MFLKTLDIRGFKSFADRATFDFEPGITVVVGPNGSGKSNVVDAIAWVLGAQAPTAVRSQRMDDVIFAGTSTRPALGRAEVSLTIDNGSGYLPMAFNEVTISRTLFRSGDSDYAINGVACRLLDIQELLSDAGVGRQQHVVASQGQLDAILNARPEERRAVIEEAAGVLKHRRRRERSERRLAATEANLTRVGDLLREVRRQLRPLEKQAAAAARADELASEVRRLRLYVGGRELAGLEARGHAVAGRRAALAARSAEAEGGLVELDVEVGRLEDDLRRAGTAALNDSIARAETLRERARGLAAVLAERGRGLERELAQADDRSAMAVLDAEFERAHREQQAVSAELARLGDERLAVQAAERDLEAARAAAAGEGRPPSADGTSPSARLDQVLRELEGLRASLRHRAAEIERLGERRARLEDRLGRLGADRSRRRDEDASASATGDRLAQAADAADAALRTADEQHLAAEAARRAADADADAWQARAQALGEAMEQVRARAGADRLAGQPGVLGTLLDIVEIDQGWEAAVEAAIGEALRAVVVEGGQQARVALDTLDRDRRSGAVLPADAPDGLDGVDAPDAVDAAGGRSGDPAAPPVGEAIGVHVRPRATLPAARGEAVAHLLDRLLRGSVRVPGEWREVLDVAVALRSSHPRLVVVSAEGDRFAASGWHLGAARARATESLHSEARRRAAEASAARAAAAAHHGQHRDEAERARRRHQQAVRAADEHAARRRALAAAAERGDAESREADHEMAALADQMRLLQDACSADERRRRQLEAACPGLEASAGEAAVQARAAAQRAAELQERAAELVRRRGLLETRAGLLGERRDDVAARQAALRGALEEAVRATSDQERRKGELSGRGAIVGRLADVVAEALASVEDRLVSLCRRRDEQVADARELGRRVDQARRRRTEIERRVAELGEQAHRAELEAAEVAIRLDAAREALRRDLDVEPDAALEGAVAPPPLPEGMEPTVRLRDLERELRLLGPINPLARQEHEALLERHTFLEEQLADVRSGRRELARVIHAIDDEIGAAFSAAFADVAHHFSELFGTLFPGGRGELRLTDPDDLLTTGIDVEARPSGKNVRKLSLLSGGERALTALGLLFAIFRSRPSPFYVLDEVEAALDDVNLKRFLDLLEEFRPEAQLIVVSHQKRTMEIADCLYGVTMRPGASSTVLSERLRSAG